MPALSYIFWPRPPALGYDNPKVQVLLVVCAVLVVGSFIIRRWRRRSQNAQTKKLSRSWPSATLWFGVVGLVLVVARTEDISYVSMRFWWVLWGLAAVLYLVLQVRLFRARHYQTLPKVEVDDPREKYLPGKK